MPVPYALKAPIGCILWTEPERIDSQAGQLFACVDTYEDESHWTRHLLKCQECGQLYFSEFYEWIDWDGDDDPQYSTYIPVETAADIEMLKVTGPIELLQFVPRLQRDFPKGAKGPRITWMKEA